MGLQGTLDAFSLAEVLGLVEHARQTGGLEVFDAEGDSHGVLFTAAGRFCAGEAGDFGGPVPREELDTRLIDVCFLLFRVGSGGYEFTVGRTAEWPADRATDIAPIVDTVDRMAHDWPAIQQVVPSFEGVPRVVEDLEDDSLTLNRSAFRVLTAVDGNRSIRQIARETRRSTIEVCAVLRDLIEEGAVLLGSQPPRARAESVVPDAALAPEVVGALREPDARGRRIRSRDAARELEREPAASDADSSPSGSTPAPAEAELAEIVALDDVAERERLVRERAELAARAGLADAGPLPAPDAAPHADMDVPFAEINGDGPGSAAEEEPGLRTSVTTDRGAFLRLFSGLRDQG